MKKIFIVCGEVSGDRLGAWYLNNILKKNKAVTCFAVGGSYLEREGAILYENISKLSLVGIFEILPKLPWLISFISKLAKHIVSLDLDEVVLVDFPAFNLWLLKKLKKLNPDLKVIFISPPQTWVWGNWRINKLKMANELIVLYPFEVEWYKSFGLNVKWLGYPFINDLASSFSPSKSKENMIAFILGSRQSELNKLFPIFFDVIKKFSMLYPGIKILIPVAKIFSIEEIKMKFARLGFILNKDIIFVQDDKEKYELLSKCALAVSKPGTISLELALLEVPSVIAYKVSALTFNLAKFFVYVNHMSLPNLFLKEEVFKELLQRECTSEVIFMELKKQYEMFLINDLQYTETVKKLSKIKEILY